MEQHQGSTNSSAPSLLGNASGTEDQTPAAAIANGTDATPEDLQPGPASNSDGARIQETATHSQLIAPRPQLQDPTPSPSAIASTAAPPAEASDGNTTEPGEIQSGSEHSSPKQLDVNLKLSSDIPLKTTTPSKSTERVLRTHTGDNAGSSDPSASTSFPTQAPRPSVRELLPADSTCNPSSPGSKMRSEQYAHLGSWQNQPARPSYLSPSPDNSPSRHRWSSGSELSSSRRPALADASHHSAQADRPGLSFEGGQGSTSMNGWRLQRSSNDPEGSVVDNPWDSNNKSVTPQDWSSGPSSSWGEPSGANDEWGTSISTTWLGSEPQSSAHPPPAEKRQVSSEGGWAAQYEGWDAPGDQTMANWGIMTIPSASNSDTAPPQDHWHSWTEPQSTAFAASDSLLTWPSAPTTGGWEVLGGETHSADNWGPPGVASSGWDTPALSVGNWAPEAEGPSHAQADHSLDGIVSGSSLPPIVSKNRPPPSKPALRLHGPTRRYSKFTSFRKGPDETVPHPPAKHRSPEEKARAHARAQEQEAKSNAKRGRKSSGEEKTTESARSTPNEEELPKRERRPSTSKSATDLSTDTDESELPPPSRPAKRLKRNNFKTAPHPRITESSTALIVAPRKKPKPKPRPKKRVQSSDDAYSDTGVEGADFLNDVTSDEEEEQTTPSGPSQLAASGKGPDGAASSQALQHRPSAVNVQDSGKTEDDIMNEVVARHIYEHDWEGLISKITTAELHPFTKSLQFFVEWCAVLFVRLMCTSAADSALQQCLQERWRKELGALSVLQALRLDRITRLILSCRRQIYVWSSASSVSEVLRVQNKVRQCSFQSEIGHTDALCNRFSDQSSMPAPSTEPAALPPPAKKQRKR